MSDRHVRLLRAVARVARTRLAEDRAADTSDAGSLRQRRLELTASTLRTQARLRAAESRAAFLVPASIRRSKRQARTTTPLSDAPNAASGSREHERGRDGVLRPARARRDVAAP